MKKIRIPVETAQTQQGPGQFEVTFQPKYGLESADYAFVFREAASIQNSIVKSSPEYEIESL